MTGREALGQTWGRRIGYGRSPLLLVIDLNRAFTEPPRPLAADFSTVIERVNLLIGAARTGGVPILFTSVVYDSPDLSDAGHWAKKFPGHDDLSAGTDGVEIDPRLDRAPGDGELKKKYASCFFGTDLGSRLTSTGRDTVVICGVTTSGCVRSTTVDALQYGFRPIVAREATGDRWEAAHDQSLYDLEAKYADVRPLDEVCRYLADPTSQGS